MDIRIQTTGDMSVGIASDDFEIKGFSDGFCDTKEEREDLRHQLGEFFGELLDNGRCFVWFEDECQDCGSKMINGKCSSKYCVNNRED